MKYRAAALMSWFMAATALGQAPPVCSALQVFPNLSSPNDGTGNGASVADFTGDDAVDLIVWGVNSLRVMSAAPTGQFGELPETFVALSFPIKGVACGDIDNDGRRDIVVVGYSSVPNSDPVRYQGFFQILLNENGALVPQDPQAFGAKPIRAALADFDGDGHLDLLVTSQNTDESIAILQGNGRGAFRLVNELNGGLTSSDARVADVTHDGVLDVSVLRKETNNYVRVFRGLGGFAFDAPSDDLVGSFSQAIHVADMNGDGFDDIVVESSVNTCVLYLDRAGGLLQAQCFPYYTIGATTGDIDGDGDIDVIASASAGTFSDHCAQLFENDGRGQLAPPEELLVGYKPNVLRCGDFDGDGLTDLAVLRAPPGTKQISMVRGRGVDGLFASRFVDQLSTWWIASADVDADGDLDVVGGTDGSSVRVRRNDGTGSFTSTNYTVGGSTHQPVLVDVNSDGVLDIVLTREMGSMKCIAILIGQGDGTFTMLGTFDVGFTQAFKLVVVDLDGDGDLDLAMSVNSPGVGNGLVILINEGNLTFGPPQSFLLDSAWTVCAADFDGDRLPEIVVTSASQRHIWIVSRNRDGSFGPPQPIELDGDGDARAAAVGDIDGDGDVDIVVVGGPNLETVLNDGRGGLVPSRALVTMPEGGYSMTLADVTGDGVPDAAVSLFYDEDGVCVLEGRADGTFVLQGTFVGYRGGEIVVGDFDLDGDVDIIAGSTLLTYYESVRSTLREADVDCDGVVGAADLATLLGAWGPCAGCAADLNQDGVVDASDLAQLLGSWG